RRDRGDEEPRLPALPDPRAPAGRIGTAGPGGRAPRRWWRLRHPHGARARGQDGGQRLSGTAVELLHHADDRVPGCRRSARGRPRVRIGAGVERGPAQRRRGLSASVLTMALPLAYPLRSLLVRRWTAAFTAGGIALVVAVAILLAALVGGLQRMLIETGEPDNLIVMRKGATNAGSSFITPAPVHVLPALPAPPPTP